MVAGFVPRADVQGDVSASPPGTREVLVVQYLRGVAAMAVVVFHVLLGINQYGTDKRATSSLGAAGVDLFFVISGFIMLYVVWQRPLGPARFLRDRALRVLPLYWLVTLTMFVMPYVSRTIGWSSSLKPEHLLTSLACIGGVFWPGTDRDFPIYRAGWTINYEMFFYILFALGLTLNNVKASAIAVCTALIALVLIGASHLINGSIAAFYTAPILLDFVFGIALSYSYLRGIVMPARLAPWVLLAGVALLYLVAETPPRSFIKGMPASVIVAAALALEQEARRHRSAALKLLGDASYSIYLTHLFTVPASEMLFHRLFPVATPVTRVVSLIFGTGVACLGGIACFYLIERPLNGWAKRIVPRVRPR